MRAAVLAVGTEVVSGQIVNGNAAKISQYVAHAGAEVVLHETVADERTAILNALAHCAQTAQLLFVTGGLGPTTDDFTRDVISEWAELPLEFHEPSWLKIVDRLEKRGVAVAPSNRQQCFFPRGSRVLANPEGTADGFYFRKGASHLWVLPGPPGEIDAIWQSASLEKMIQDLLPPGRAKFKLSTWDCLGKSEAELGEIVERALQGSQLKTGYRLHRPYIEVKVWVPEDQAAEAKPWLQALETAIGPWLGTKDGQDIAENWLRCLRTLHADHDELEIEIYDACSGGLLTERIGALLRKPEHRETSQAITLATEWQAPDSPDSYVETTLDSAPEEMLTLTLAGISPRSEWTLGLKLGSREFHETLKSPYSGKGLQDDRLKTYIVETSLRKWSEWLLKLVS